MINFDGMMSGGGMTLMGVYALLITILLALGIAALIKYLQS
jgi:hypothetical protein